MSEFRWTKQRSQAAQLVADDRLTDLAIAVEVGISDRQLRRWKHVPKFQAQVEKHVEKTFGGLSGAAPGRVAQVAGSSDR